MLLENTRSQIREVFEEVVSQQSYPSNDIVAHALWGQPSLCSSKVVYLPLESHTTCTHPQGEVFHTDQELYTIFTE